MTKLIDIKGAREALPIAHYDYNGEGWFCNNDLSEVHLEVDVEAMAKMICLYEYGGDETAWDKLDDIEQKKYKTEAAFVIHGIYKWARLVRK